MSQDLFDKIIAEISYYRNHVEKVMLYLDCEPLLDRNIHHKIRQTKRAGIKKVNIATNGSVLNKKRAIELICAGLDEIYISIDSLSKEVYEKIRRGLNFETVHTNTINFIQLRNKLNPELIIRIQLILQELNWQESNHFLEYWSQFLAPNDQIAIQRAHNWASSVPTLKFGDESALNHIPCIALWGTFVIHVNGDVGLCCMDTSCSILLGNVKMQSISEIWRGKVLQDIRDLHLEGKRSEIPLCDGCSLWRESKRSLQLLSEKTEPIIK